MLANIATLILDAVGGFFCALLLGRAWMQWARVSFRNELGQFVIKLTDWAVLPMRRIVPGLMGIDLPTLVAAWLLQAILLFVEFVLRGFPLGSAAAVLLVMALAVLELAKVCLYLVMIVVIVSAVLSWVSPYSPVAPLVGGLARPFLRPFQRFVPTISNIDLSPLVLFLVLQVLLIVLGGMRQSLMQFVLG